MDILSGAMGFILFCKYIYLVERVQFCRASPTETGLHFCTQKSIIRVFGSPSTVFFQNVERMKYLELEK
jgi:hypothetical protein